MNLNYLGNLFLNNGLGEGRGGLLGCGVGKAVEILPTKRHGLDLKPLSSQETL